MMLTLHLNTRDNSGHSGQARKHRLRTCPDSHLPLGTTRDSAFTVTSFHLDFAAANKRPMSCPARVEA
jgi:hypothetical protein